MTYLNRNKAAFVRYTWRAAVIGGLTVLAACGAPPVQTISTTTESTSTTPAAPTLSPGGNLQPGQPGTTTTSSYSSQTSPAPAQ